MSENMKLKKFNPEIVDYYFIVIMFFLELIYVDLPSNSELLGCSFYLKILVFFSFIYATKKRYFG